MAWAVALQATIASHRRDLDVATAPSLKTRLEELIKLAQTLFEAMEFGLLFDADRQLLSIGYRVGEGSLDQSYYDLLASEARLASFVAIAKGDVPTRHWFHLGRTVTSVHGGVALVSWSGSMFEYLMPYLVMRPPPGSLLDETHRNIVRRQKEYGAERGLPWGVSESAYNARDLEFTYQYSSFGVPGLGLKRSLGDEAVVAPYATALAAMITPEAAVRNFAAPRAQRARTAGMAGTKLLTTRRSRLPEDEKVAIVRCYMAHHQGMTLIALANALHDGTMRVRFHAEPIVQATELLLQERTPRDVDAIRPREEEVKAAAYVRELIPPSSRRFQSPHQATVQTQLLSNGRYAVMMTAAGSGYSRWGDLAVTRWREDPTCDCWGSYVFLRDVDTGAVWSAGYQPSGVEPDSYDASFFEDRVEISRRDGSITTRLEVAVSPEDDAEVRRVTISNLGKPDARNRVDVLCGNRAGATGQRHRASSLLEFVRADRVCRRTSALFLPRAAVGRPMNPKSGRHILPSSKGTPSAACSSKPIERVFSVEAVLFAHRSRSSMASLFPTPPALCLIRSLAFAVACGWRRERLRTSRFGRSWRHPATTCSI